MGNFDIAYPKTVRNEGDVLTNTVGDAGELSYGGISSKWFPDWEGFRIAREKNLKPGQSLPELAPLKKAFYKTNFWDKVRGDEINSQEIAESVFDFAVNTGIVPAIKMIQRSAGIAETGKMDDFTINTLNNK